MGSGWQSIETAPKDGTRVLVYGVALYYDGEAFDRGAPCVGVAEWVNRNTEWRWESPHAYYYDTSYKATHWMPLPEPPA